MSSTLEKPQAGKPSRRRLPLVVLGLVLIAGLAIWLIIIAWGGSNATVQGDGQGSDEQSAISANETQDQAPVEPITTFEGAKSGDWPSPEDSVGCGYVVERLTVIANDIQTEGIDAMRGWLDAMDDLQGDPSVADANAQFDAVKRTWSTVLASDSNEEQVSGDELKGAQASLDELIVSIDCD